jgi:hypothetical protein
MRNVPSGIRCAFSIETSIAVGWGVVCFYIATLSQGVLTQEDLAKAGDRKLAEGPCSQVIARSAFDFPIDCYVGNLRVVGVRHSRDEMLASGANVLRAINSAHIVLLEHSDDDPKYPNYFATLASEARRQGKLTVTVDPQGEGSDYALALLIGLLVVSVVYCRRRKLWVTSYGVSLVLTLFIYPSASLLLTEEYSAFDFSNAVDARTLVMMDRVEEIAAKNPDLNVAFVSGGFHAGGFLYYKSHPTERAWRRRLYGVLYAWSWRPSICPGGPCLYRGQSGSE